MTFDERIKARTAQEDCPVPEGFEERMAARLDRLGAQKPHRFRRRRALFAAALIAAAGLTAAAAAPYLIRMTQGRVGFFEEAPQNAGLYYRSRRTGYEAYNAAAGISQTTDGVTLTIDNLTTDDNYLTVFYTMTSETPISKPGTYEVPESTRARWAAPDFYALIDGKTKTSAHIDQDAYMENDNCLKGMQRLALTEPADEVFDLMLYVPGRQGLEDARFQFTLSVDRSEILSDALTVYPDKQFEADGYTVCVERVSVSPLGNTLTLRETATGRVSPILWEFFVLRDENGSYLQRPNEPPHASGDETAVFEFFGADAETEAISIIPYTLSNDPPRTVSAMLDELPLDSGEQNRLTLESVRLNGRQAEAVFSVCGAMPFLDGAFELTDENGDVLSFNKFASSEISYDDKSGRMTVVLSYLDASEEEAARIAGVRFQQPPALILQEERAVTIKLQ